MSLKRALTICASSGPWPALDLSWALTAAGSPSWPAWPRSWTSGAEKSRDRRMEGNALGNLGNACAALGEAQRAIAFYEQALAISREIGDRRGEGNHLANMGRLYEDTDPARAGALWVEALRIYEAIEDRRAPEVRAWLVAL
jgi:tetratricopeptide (TPR) repeat protein